MLLATFGLAAVGYIKALLRSFTRALMCSLILMPASPHQSQTGQLAGHVITADGSAIRDAAVMLTGKSPPHKDIAALTDTYGRFQFDDLVPGTYTVLVNAEGFSPQTKTVTVSPGLTARLTFVLTAEEREH